MNQNNPPFVHTTADDKPSQGTITVSQVISTPAIQLALDRMPRWSRAIKLGVAGVLSNRAAFSYVGASAEESAIFDALMDKVRSLMRTDSEFASLMDPSFVIVDFGGAPVPALYRTWLEQVNQNIGGAPVGAAGPGKFNVTASGNQPIRFLDPNLNHLNMLHINTRFNADFVAGQLLQLGGLHSWVLETAEAPVYR